MTFVQTSSTRMGLMALLVVVAGGCANQQSWPQDTGLSRVTPPPTTPHTAPATTNAPHTSAAAYGLNDAQASAAQAAEPNDFARPIRASATTNVTRVTFSEEGADFDPCVSRDGEKLVFASTAHRPTADLYIKRVNSRTVTQLTNGGSDNVMPDISPDGQRIAFASNRSGNWDIFVMPITGGQAVQISSDTADELHPSWSSDGSSLVFCKLGETSGRWEMWVVDTSNAASQTFIGYGLFPEWCPQAAAGEGGSERILFQLSRDRGRRTFGVWTMDYSDGTAKNLTEVASEPEKALINPTWSHDGRWICYAEVPLNSQESQGTAKKSRLPENATLWMVGADGTGKVNLVEGGGASLMPTWACDGSVFFVSNRGGYENIWSMSTKGAVLAAMGPEGPASPHQPVAEGEVPDGSEQH